MRQILLIICALFSFSLYAQEKSVAKVHYIFKHINDTTVPEKFIRDDVATFLGKSSSYYKSVSSESMNRQVKKQTSSASFDGNLVLTSNTSPLKSSYILNVENNTVQYFNRIASDEYLIEDEFPVQDWEILDETKEIGDYNCQKAITKFKGRTYEAWFTTELPFPFGPWKLHGLPGLILSAKDSKDEVSFEYDGFDKLDETNSIVIETPAKAIKAKKEEVTKLEKLFAENPSGYLNSRSGARISSSGTVTVTATAPASSKSNALDSSKIKSVTVKKDETYKPSNITNNPIELAQ